MSDTLAPHLDNRSCAFETGVQPTPRPEMVRNGCIAGQKKNLCSWRLSGAGQDVVKTLCGGRPQPEQVEMWWKLCLRQALAIQTTKPPCSSIPNWFVEFWWVLWLHGKVTLKSEGTWRPHVELDDPRHWKPVMNCMWSSCIPNSLRPSSILRLNHGSRTWMLFSSVSLGGHNANMSIFKVAQEISRI